MLQYTVKRILFFVPSVFFISVICFGLIRSIPGDMVDFIIRSQTDELTRNRDSKAIFEKKYREKAAELGTDLPAFYIQLGTLAVPRSLSFEWNPVRKEVIEKLIEQTGNAEASTAWYTSIEELDQNIVTHPEYFDAQQFIDVQREIQKLFYITDRTEIAGELQTIQSIFAEDTLYTEKNAWINTCHNQLNRLNTQESKWKNYIPVIRFYTTCAYGNWLFGDGKNSKGIIRGDFGKSIIDHKSINQSLGERIGLTVCISLISILLAFLFAVPLGIVSALFAGSWIEKSIHTFLFILYALPSFWVASLSIIWLAGSDGVNWFAPYGTGKIEPNMGLLEIIQLKWHHFALPIFTWTYSGIAFISKQTQAALQENMKKQYVLSAIARGLPYTQIIWRHLMPNSLRPLITIAANILPGLIGGSVVLETIFSLPGLGEWAYRGFLYHDIPVIMAVLFWGSILTLTGYLIADILLAYTNPTIRFNSKR